MKNDGMLEATKAALDKRLADEQRAGRTPSLVGALVRDGELVWWGRRGTLDGHANGPRPDEDTQYRIGSITKTFVAVLVLRLRDEGKLALDDQLDKHLPGTPFGDRTIGALLAHAAGLSSEAPGPWWERAEGKPWPEFATELDAESVRIDPYRRFHYSNLGFGVLGELVAQLRGKSWFEATQEEILDPLGMPRTTTGPEGKYAPGFAVHPWADVLLREPSEDAKAMAPAGQLWSTVTDLARWTRFFAGDTAEVLSRDTLAEMSEPRMIGDGNAWLGGYGLGLQLFRRQGRRFTGHTGSMPGFLATSLAASGDDIGALVMANVTRGPEIDAVVTDLVDILETREPRLGAEWHASATVDTGQLELTGPWYWGPMPYALRLLPDGWLDLSPMNGGGRASRFQPYGDGTWIGLDGYFTREILRVNRDAAGNPNHLWLGTFIFTRTPYATDAPVPGGVDEKGWHTP